jgi:hypothetical protein
MQLRLQVADFAQEHHKPANVQLIGKVTHFASFGDIFGHFAGELRKHLHHLLASSRR